MEVKTVEVGMQGTTGKAIRAAALMFVALCALAIGASSASALPPVISGTTVSGVTTTSATLEAEVNPEGAATEFHFEYGTVDCTPEPSLCTSTPEGIVPSGTSPVTIKETVEGLSPATIYHVRLVARHGAEVINGPDHVFATYSSPLLGLPGGRAYEQASPIDKDGGDAVGDVALVKAAASGGGITFGSTFGIPGGKGAQELPSYLALRGPGQSGWSTQGLLPPARLGERAQVMGWTPDYTEVFSKAAKLGEPIETAFFAQRTEGSAPFKIAPYTEGAEYSYAGQSPDGSTVFFEVRVKLPVAEGEPAAKGFSNLYAWDRASGKISLAGVLNDKTAPPKGTFAGPYNWAIGTNAKGLREGGAGASYYLQATHAVSASGDIYFTEAGNGQLYLRRNPTQPQSALDGEDKCTEAAKACTIQVSASEKTDGESKDSKDPVGAQPAAFQAASADGSEVFFTSPEKLTNEANTGPEQPEAAIGLGNSSTGLIEEEELLPQAAVGVAVDSEYIYWANPTLGAIGRAKLNGTGKPTEVNESFVDAGTVKFEVSPGVFESVASEPRYVAVGNGHIYWTNTGRRDENGDPLDGGGTIGRATLNGAAAPSEGEIEPDFILGASNPQGIAVNAENIYWANVAKDPTRWAIARAGAEGEAVEQSFHSTTGISKTPYGVALSSSDVYFSANEEGNDLGSIRRFPLKGGEEKFLFIGKARIRGVAVDGTSVYWAAQGEGAIGKANLELDAASKVSKFVEVHGALNGLAAEGTHLYWSINGESATNPGNDLYRYRPAADPSQKGTLEDLTALGTVGTGNGAEVQGVVGLSDDGSDLYFVANGDLDATGPASAGDCHTPSLHGSLPSVRGECNLYAWHEGAISLVARLKAGGDRKSDAVDWVGAPVEVFGGGGYTPKSAFLSKDGQTLLFRSQAKLGAFDNEGAPELYRYRAGEDELRCVSCRPSGEAVGRGPSLGSVSYPGIGPLGSVAGTASRNLSADGNHAFFETAEALSLADTNGAGGCLPSGGGNQNFPACLDVYEWVASGTDSCQPASPSYSPLNAGCLYLISTGKDKFPSLFADASESGGDVFFFTRQSLVGQDKDELQDVYDARAGGGLAAQNPLALAPCEGAEACHGAPAPAPAETSPGTAGFVGPANPKPKKPKPKKNKHKKHQKKQGKQHKKQGHKNNHRAGANRGTGR